MLNKDDSPVAESARAILARQWRRDAAAAIERRMRLNGRTSHNG